MSVATCPLGSQFLKLQKDLRKVQKVKNDGHLSSLQVHGVQVAIVIFNLNGPGLIIVFVFVAHMDDRTDHMCEDLEHK